MSKPHILIQLDTDSQPSVFDGVVAVDSGVAHLFRHSGITAESVRDRVHGAVFTRGVDDLKSTALFIGGSDVALGERVLTAVKKSFFGPMRVSVMLDSNGSNTTAAAAVLAARKHLELAETTALVLGGTGPVGRRAALLLAREGAKVRVGSRSAEKAEEVCREISEVVPGANLVGYAAGTPEQTAVALVSCQLVIAAGAAGVELLSTQALFNTPGVRVAIDLNAVPPAGIGGVEPLDKAAERDGIICYGPIGVGGTKMKIHKAAIRRLFETNDAVLDAEELYELGKSL
ncbi:MAG: bifunctional NADP-dependent methylenetetrahydromethanopterin dehydrogenase/methylenetetrahydrofolate dehydrogenase [Planctomycetaceae bacterium]|nr:bifunctional NADP-dependent methylenetetrahydromethanopterin dehydrogenase/methylenetetrahydrofolate dehydrogenase [Planctomycetaceae bacterium]